MTPRPLPVVVLISGRGSNLQAIIDCHRAGQLPVDIRAVISNRPAAAGLALAAQAGIETTVIDHTAFGDRAGFEQALSAAIDHHSPALVVLAGFMRVLGADFVAHYHGRMINIHPSLLPEFPGLDTHRRAIEAGAGTHGASVHFVTADVDGGPVFAQARVPVLADDTPEELAARVLEQEHRLLPTAIHWIAAGRIELDPHGEVRLDGSVLGAPRNLAEEAALSC